MCSVSSSIQSYFFKPVGVFDSLYEVLKYYSANMLCILMMAGGTTFSKHGPHTRITILLNFWLDVVYKEPYLLYLKDGEEEWVINLYHRTVAYSVTYHPEMMCLLIVGLTYRKVRMVLMYTEWKFQHLMSGEASYLHNIFKLHKTWHI